jgi:hypothetical protein
MNFSTGVLHFRRNYKEGNDNINATQVTAYQYLGMTKIAMLEFSKAYLIL